MTYELMWNSTSRTYQAIRHYDDCWFVASDLGIDYARAKAQLEEWNARPNSIR